MIILDSEGNPTKELFLFLKYNKTVEKVDSLPESEKQMYVEFCNQCKELVRSFNQNAPSSSALGSILSMFGFKRHYCSTCGLPIIGSFSKIGNRVTCDTCFQSFKIIQAMDKKTVDVKSVENSKEKK